MVTMSRETKHLGIGAVVSFQCKFIHPHRLRDERFPNPSVGQRLSDAYVVRRALKKIKHNPVVCVVVHHHDFKDNEGRHHEIWCSENHVRVEKEGDPELLFARHQVKRQTETDGNGALESGNIENQEFENRMFTTPSLVDHEKDDTKKVKPLATFSEVFSFAKSSKSRTNLAIGLFASVLSGLVQPGNTVYPSLLLLLRSCVV